MNRFSCSILISSLFKVYCKTVFSASTIIIKTWGFVYKNGYNNFIRNTDLFFYKEIFYKHNSIPICTSMYRITVEHIYWLISSKLNKKNKPSNSALFVSFLYLSYKCTVIIFKKYFIHAVCIKLVFPNIYTPTNEYANEPMTYIFILSNG